MPRTLPHSILIIGAGAAGLFAARRFRQLGVQQITLIEKTDHIGGKCSTYTHPYLPGLKAERGAVAIAANYGVVLDAIKEKKIDTELLLPTRQTTVEIANQVAAMSLWGKI